jgi:predicted Rossmann-fold nucleotide-binding protein
LIQTERIAKFPVILFGKEYWKGMLDWLRNTVLKNGSISREDLDIFTVVDNPKEAVTVIKKFYKQKR